MEHKFSPFLFHMNDQSGSPVVLDAEVRGAGFGRYHAAFDLGAHFGEIQFKFSQCSLRNRIGVWVDGPANRAWEYKDRDTGAKFGFADPFGIYPDSKYLS